MILRNAIQNTDLNFDNVSGWFNILDVNPGEVNSKTGFYVSPFAAAHRIFTNSMGSLPLKLYKKENEARILVDKHHTSYTLKIRANERMSPFMMQKIAASQLFLYGEAFIYPHYDKGSRLIELIPFITSSVQKHKDSEGKLWIIVSADGEVRKFRETELIHLYWETTDGASCVGVLKMAKETIENDRMGQKYAARFYKNGARPSGVIEVDSSLSKEQRERVRDTFERVTSGMDNAFRVAVMDTGMKYTQLGIPQKDAQFIESRNFTVDEVSRFTGIPMYKLQAGKQSYQSNEQQGIEYVVGTLQPIAIQWEQEISYKLLTKREQEQGLYYRFNLSSEMRGDSKSRAAFYDVMIRNGVYSPNECRSFEEMNGYSGGEHYFMTKNYATVKEMIEGGKNE